MASKYQEIYPPILRDLVYMTNDAYSQADVLRMETLLLSRLQYSLTFPTPLAFTETYMQALSVTDLPTELFSRYLLDLSLLRLNMQNYTPSTIALAVLTVVTGRMQTTEPYARLGFGPQVGAVQALVQSEGLGRSMLAGGVTVAHCANELEALAAQVLNQPELNAILVKYRHRSYASIRPLIGLPDEEQV